MALHDHLKTARLAVGKTQEQVAREAEMHVTQYNGYERGRSRPTPATLERLAVALATTVAALDVGETAPSRSQPLSGSVSFTHLKAELADHVANALGVSAHQVVIKIEIQ